MPVKRGVKKGASSSKVKKKTTQSKAAEAKREPSAGTSAAPARDAEVTQPGAAAVEPAPKKTVSPADLQATTQRRQKLAEELQAVEKQIYDLETRYLENSHPLGNALKGYEGLLTQSQASTRRTLVRHEDRLFSNSSSSGVPH